MAQKDAVLTSESCLKPGRLEHRGNKRGVFFNGYLAGGRGRRNLGIALIMVLVGILAVLLLSWQANREAAEKYVTSDQLLGVLEGNSSAGQDPLSLSDNDSRFVFLGMSANGSICAYQSELAPADVAAIFVSQLSAKGWHLVSQSGSLLLSFSWSSTATTGQRQLLVQICSAGGGSSVVAQFY